MEQLNILHLDDITGSSLRFLALWDSCLCSQLACPRPREQLKLLDVTEVQIPLWESKGKYSICKMQKWYSKWVRGIGLLPTHLAELWVFLLTERRSTVCFDWKWEGTLQRSPVAASNQCRISLPQIFSLLRSVWSSALCNGNAPAVSASLD